MVWVKRIFKGLLVFVLLVGLSVAGLELYARDQFGRVLDRCAGLHELDNRYNPVGLVSGAAECARAGRIDDALGLYMLGGAYGRFDMYRVKDRTAHQAMSIVIANAFGALDEKDRNAFKLAVTGIDSEAPRHVSACRALRRIGHPAYEPVYMTSHGIGNFTGSTTGDGLVEGFDADSAWEKVLTEWAKCAPKNGEVR
ncbi:hypothetical protein ACKVEX_05340 [Rhodocyclaceae bacterium SMB388]